MKLIKIFFGIAAVLVAGFFLLNSYIYNEKQGGESVTNIQNLNFVLDGTVIQFKDSVFQTDTPKTITRYFGNEVVHDIDGDGDTDVVFLVTQETGGSGTFFYVVGAISTGEGYEGTQALFIGDRIAPQTTTVGDGRQVVVNYADRAPGESFTEAPSVGKSLYLLYDINSNSFGEVVQDFEGESAFPLIRVKIGETKSGAGVSITPEEVLEDSRCPEGVQCIWEGTLRVRSQLESGLGSASQEFTLHEPITTEAEIVTLFDALPVPQDGVVIPSDQYILFFKVEKR